MQFKVSFNTLTGRETIIMEHAEIMQDVELNRYAEAILSGFKREGIVGMTINVPFYGRVSLDLIVPIDFIGKV